MAQVRFDPDSFAKLAHQLTEQNQSEAHLRTAISRVYYSLFLTALYHFHGNGLIPKNRIQQQPKNRRGTHAVIIDEVKRISITLGGQLDNLRELRIQADYRLLPDQGYSNWSNNWHLAQLLETKIREEFANRKVA